jgi:hypothetical protein
VQKSAAFPQLLSVPLILVWNQRKNATWRTWLIVCVWIKNAYRFSLLWHPGVILSTMYQLWTCLHMEEGANLHFLSFLYVLFPQAHPFTHSLTYSFTHTHTHSTRILSLLSAKFPDMCDFPLNSLGMSESRSMPTLSRFKAMHMCSCTCLQGLRGCPQVLLEMLLLFHN